MIYEQGKKAARVIAEGKEVAQIWAEGKKVFQHVPSGGVMELEYTFPYSFTLNLGEVIGNDIYGITNALVDFGDGSEPVYISSAAGIIKSKLTHSYQKGTYRVTVYGTVCVGVSGFSSNPENQYLTAVYLPTGNSPIRRLRKFAFSHSGLTTVPEKLLANAVDETDFSGIFANNANMTSVPANIFRYNTKAEIFDNAFSYCGITAIPSGLFAYNTKAQSFAATFYGAIKYSSIPSNIYANQTGITNLDSCFYHQTYEGEQGPVSGALPTLWTKFPNAAHTDCFKCWDKATNYSAAKTAGWG